MKIRRYLGNNTQEAILKVKMDLGNEALILNTRKVRKKGLMNFFKKQMVEVLAAIDDDYGVKKESDLTKSSEKIQNIENNKNYFDKKEEKFVELENKVNKIEVLLEKIYEQVQATPKKEDAAKPVDKQQIQNKVLQLFYNNLLKNEVDAELAKKIIDRVREKVGENSSVNEVANALYEIINNILGKSEVIKLRDDGKPTVIIFVGPTGVGKTTTIAKVAANFTLSQHKSIGMITADTYRIAAVAQLKTYAEILGIPINVIYSADEMKEAIEAYSDKDIILIDTAGRSHRNKPHFDELKTLIEVSYADEIYLVLSTTISTNTCKEIISNYSFLKDYKLIFTKTDEAPGTGVILTARHITDKSLSYITTGQSVPDDIEVANIDKLAKILIGSIAQ